MPIETWECTSILLAKGRDRLWDPCHGFFGHTITCRKLCRCVENQYILAVFPTYLQAVFWRTIELEGHKLKFSSGISEYSFFSSAVDESGFQVFH
jgi:hypothetical protein